MFVLGCDITIGPFNFKSVHEVKVRRSLHNYLDTASIKIPASARLRQNGILTETVETAKAIQAHMPVLIKLGYNGDLRQEFRGYVARVNVATPCEIEVEGMFHLLKFKTYKKAFREVSLKQLFEYLIAELPDIQLSRNMPDAPLGVFYCDGRTGTEILEELKKDGFAIYFRDNELYGGLQYTEVYDTVKYRLGWNVIKDNQLKYRREQDVKARIKAIYIKPDNERIVVTVGNGSGIERTQYYTNISGKDDNEIKKNLRLEAEGDLKELSYDGYEGKITTFLQPFAVAGDAAEIEDENYPERSGKYIIETSEVTFGTGGARRVLEIGKTVSRQR
jgi:hypothetical protein